MESGFDFDSFYGAKWGQCMTLHIGRGRLPLSQDGCAWSLSAPSITSPPGAMAARISIMMRLIVSVS